MISERDMTPSDRQLLIEVRDLLRDFMSLHQSTAAAQSEHELVMLAGRGGDLVADIKARNARKVVQGKARRRADG